MELFIKEMLYFTGLRYGNFDMERLYCVLMRPYGIQVVIK